MYFCLFYKLTIFGLFFTLNILFSNPTAFPSKIDNKCLWIVRTSMTSKEKIDKAMAFAYSSGYNNVFIQVRGRGDAYYNSSIISKYHKIEDDFDPLAYALLLGKSYGIKVHAWVNTYILWSSSYTPKDLNHLYFKHPEWLESDINGKSDKDIKLHLKKSINWEGVYLSPLHPEVNDYLNVVFSEIMKNYDIDGIHLDYIRFHDEVYGFNIKGRENFKNNYDIDPQDIARGIIAPRFGWSESFSDSIKSEWKNFKTNSITELLVKINKSRDSLNKNIIISAAVKPNLVEAKDRWYQDWTSWIENGLLDMAVPMNYVTDINKFSENLFLIKNNINYLNFDNIVIGVSTYNQDPLSAVDKIYISKLNGFKNISIFSYDSHVNNLDYLNPVKEALNQ